MRATRRIGELMDRQREAGLLAKPTGGHRPKGQRVSKKPDALHALRSRRRQAPRRRRAKSWAMEHKLEVAVVKAISPALTGSDGRRGSPEGHLWAHRPTPTPSTPPGAADRAVAPAQAPRQVAVVSFIRELCWRPAHRMSPISRPHCSGS
jgi:hypothetical protein